ncbi:hypothetical protein H4R18_005777, partial [Coemansia javaensis]
DGENYYLQSVKSKDGYYRTASQKIKFRKRPAGDSDDEMEVGSDDNDNDNDGGAKAQAQAQAQAQARGPAARRGRGGRGGGAAYGREFRAKKAHGDVKRGNVDPYAYVPLNPKTMKRGALSVKGSSKKHKRARVGPA